MECPVQKAVWSRKDLFLSVFVIKKLKEPVIFLFKALFDFIINSIIIFYPGR